MAQKTNLNISPYYDDFDSEKNFYKVLFRPGYPVQARELTTLQSILQDQIESFGSHVFKEGSVVIPGNIAFDNQFYSVKLNSTNSGVDVALYIKNFIGKKITGQTSNTTAKIQHVELVDGDIVNELTIYVKYLDSSSDFTFEQFQDGEQLTCDENVIYGNTTISAGTPFASLIASDSTSIGSAASIGKGIYFIRGSFVNVSQQTLVLDYYTNTPSYRVGLKIDELIINAKDDDSLYDNAKGFSNYAAPGADRFKINLTLTKKLLTDVNDTDFVELLRLKEGKIQKVTTKTQYNKIRDYLAERTYDESGDYAVKPFDPTVHNSLNNRLGSNGIFFDTEKTEDGNTPNDDLMCLKISPGKAYIRGYDVEKVSTTIIDVDKPRDTEEVTNVSVPFEMGHLVRINNVTGIARHNAQCSLWARKLGDSPHKIGDARVYTCNVTDEAYKDATTQFDLRLYDLQTYTVLTLNQSVDATDLPSTAYVRGRSSGASGYAAYAGNNGTVVTLRQTSGKFSKGEQITINGIDSARTIASFIEYGTQNIKAITQGASTGFDVGFSADTVCAKFRMPGGINQITMPPIISGVATVTAGGRLFTGIRTDTIISYQRPGFTTDTYNRVSSVAADGLSIELSPIGSGAGIAVTGVYDGKILSSFNTSSSRPQGDETLVTPVAVGPIVSEFGGLFSELPDSNISSVNLLNSNLIVSEQLKGRSTDSSGELTFDLSASGISSAAYVNFDQERYSVNYVTGGIGTITSDTFDLSNNTVTLRGLRPSQSGNIVVNTTLQKYGIQSKVKQYNRSQQVSITRSKYEKSGVGVNTSVVDGLDHNVQYGLRVQDEEICLNYPDVAKVLTVYESLDTGDPTLDKVTFTSTASVHTNAVIGENIIGGTSNAVARVVSTPTANTLEIVYLTADTFEVAETVTFEESNIVTEVETITLGNYKDITSSYGLDKGQKEQYYDYSRLIRKHGAPEPTRRLLVVFDYYSVPSNDNGDVFTVLSYDKERFGKDIPNIGPFQIRASDTLDFRPRVSVFDPSTDFLSPFDFSSRDIDGTNGPNLLLSSDEFSIIGYSYYLPRVDKLYLNKYGEFIVEKGISSRFPKAPIKNDALLEIATINLPPYLYNPQNASLTLIDNKRYTMRDIGYIEDRVENLEEVTTLSLLELDTQSIQIQDADGRNRFKSGFFVDPFRDYSLIDRTLSSIEVNPEGNEIAPIIARNSLKSQIAPSASITDQNLDLNDNFELLDPNVQKTGQSVTLKYNEIDWIEQPFATTVENVNPFNVVSYTGTVRLNPEVDTWVRTIQLPDRNITRTTNRSRSITQNLTSRIRLNLGEARIAVTRTLEQRGNTNGELNRTRVQWTNMEMERLRARSRSVSTATNTDTISFDDVNTRNELISASDETFMRSRNTEFKVSNLKPFTRFYQFLDGNSGVDFTPKLIEIANSSSLDNFGTQSGSFEVGETVIGSIETNFSGAFGPTNYISFRVATSNHKSGSFNNPDSVYNVNPYIRGESIPSSYSQSSKTLNIDTSSLAQEAQGLYSGYLVKGMKLVGQTSGAIAYVKDLRLVSDNYGDLNGTFFLRDPHSSPVPSVRIQTGTKTFKITSSSTNDTGLPGSNSVSFGESNYTADGTLNQWQNEVTTTTRNLTTTTTTNLTTDARASLNVNFGDRTVIEEYSDPLAQTFVVGGNVEAPSDFDTSDDVNGAYLTAVDLYFAKVDSGNAPVVVQVRTTLLGTPTRTVLGNSVTLRPTTTDANGNTVQAIQTSDTGEVATKVTFPEPIYLAPNAEYAIVIISANSDEYELWTATMGERTVGTQSLPDVETVRYTQQFALGSLFKSQNGSIWSPNQYQDLKFKLYKASFTSTTGTAYFYNPTLDNSNGYVPNLGRDAIRTLPKSGSIGITTIAGGHPTLVGILTEGRKLSGQGGKGGSAVVVGRGSSVDANAGVGNSLGITEGGTNYKIDTSVDTFNITGSGTGLKLEINSINANTGAITGIAIASPGSTDPTTDTHGNGYKIGDVVGIVTSSVVSQTGESARITITGISTDIDTLYLSNIQGEFGSTGSNKSFAIGAAVSYYNDSGTVVSAASTTIRSTSATGGVESGNLMKVEHFNHGMYSNTNKVTLSDIETTIAPTTLSATVSLDEATSVSVASTTNFTTFEGVTVDSNNPGYIKIGNEIIKYDSVGSGTLSIASNGRAIDSTIVSSHNINTLVYKYELNGISLRRINKTHTISDPIGIDDYYITINRSENGPGIDRDTDLATGTGMPELSFTNEESTGGSKIKATENILYNSVIPTYGVITPGSSTSINATIRSISGTSIDGTESSFNDEGFEPLGINVLNTFNTTRIVCSQINENTYLTNLPRNKSFTTGITLNSSDSNLSPIIFLDQALTEFRISRLDKPILDYTVDDRVNSILDDPHATVYVSNTVDLANPATSLKVILSAYRDASSDFRVLYNLIKADSSEIQQTFQLFPGYNNLKNTEQSGIAVVDESKNSGLPDSFVPASLTNQFLEYEFTADNLELFIGYTIKIVMSGSNQATPPRIKELRTIAVR